MALYGSGDGGHALPGSFFLLFGLWWPVKFALKHHSMKLKKKGRTHRSFNRLEIVEGAVKVIFAMIGELKHDNPPNTMSCGRHDCMERRYLPARALPIDLLTLACFQTARLAGAGANSRYSFCSRDLNLGPFGLQVQLLSALTHCATRGP
uniref:Uncharacterized protein n=1 Tax=Anolis carolinensis TaxID=28377 RepID=A0A803T914_ANOCA